MALTKSHILKMTAAAGGAYNMVMTPAQIAQHFNTAITKYGDGQFNTTAKVAALLSESMMESAYFRTTEEYAKNGRYAPYIGRTAIQITWKENYRAFGNWCKKNGLLSDANYFVNNPKRLADKKWFALGPVWYFTSVQFHGKPLTSYAGNIGQVGKAVNLGDPYSNATPNGQSARQAAYKAVKSVGSAIVPTGGGGKPSANPGKPNTVKKSTYGAIKDLTKHKGNTVLDAAAKAGHKVTRVYGYNSTPDHNNLRCIDFMHYDDMAMGNGLVKYLKKHKAELGVAGIIHNRRIMGFPSQGDHYKGPEGKWRPYSGPSPHTDHVHVEFNSNPISGNLADTITSVTEIDPEGFDMLKQRKTLKRSKNQTVKGKYKALRYSNKKSSNLTWSKGGGAKVARIRLGFTGITADDSLRVCVYRVDKKGKKVSKHTTYPVVDLHGGNGRVYRDVWFRWVVPAPPKGTKRYLRVKAYSRSGQPVKVRSMYVKRWQ